MDNFTPESLGLYYQRMKANEFDTHEQLARVVWAVANGWKRTEKMDDSELKKMGVMD